jgi:aminoglycoside phosphotransferase (APT) family kinase protein
VASVPIGLARLGAAYGEQSLRPAGGVKSAVAIGEHYVFKVVEAGKSSAADLKEQRVLHLLAQRLPDRARALVPRAVGSASVDGLGVVEVHQRLPGEAPRTPTDALCASLGTFLRDLHDCASYPDVTEFEGERPRPFAEYLTASAAKFRAKLSGVVGAADLRLVDAAVDVVTGYAQQAGEPPELVVVHKDLGLPNLLASAGGLSGVVDWAAAQTAPREWEMAVVQQRFGEASQAVFRSYGRGLDPELLRVCAALQAIRFWKSFVDNAQFVEQQRALLRRVL